MTDLTKIERPYGLCTQEEQEGLNALVGIKGALQLYGTEGKWITREFNCDLSKWRVYRQNPDWEQPKLDVPDWVWENTKADFVAMDWSGSFYAYEVAPLKGAKGRAWIAHSGELFSLSSPMITHDFNPHNVPWDQSLTKRPGEFTYD